MSRDADDFRDVSRSMRLLVQHGHRSKALAILEDALQKQTSIDLLRLAAELRLDGAGRNDARRAMSYLRPCYARQPRNPETLVLLQKALETLELHEAAASVREELTRLVQYALDWSPPGVFPGARKLG